MFVFQEHTCFEYVLYCVQNNNCTVSVLKNASTHSVFEGGVGGHC